LGNKAGGGRAASGLVRAAKPLKGGARGSGEGGILWPLSRSSGGFADSSSLNRSQSAADSNTRQAPRLVYAAVSTVARPTRAQQSIIERRNTMGKIVNSTFVSLDGVINHMDRWHFDLVEEQTNAIALQQLRDSDPMLMGRYTHDVYAGTWPGRDGDYADRINAIPKYVVSKSLTTVDWANTTVLNGDLIEAVTKLK